jgi:hypothetical protein
LSKDASSDSKVVWNAEESDDWIAFKATVCSILEDTSEDFCATPRSSLRKVQEEAVTQTLVRYQSRGECSRKFKRVNIPRQHNITPNINSTERRRVKLQPRL